MPPVVIAQDIYKCYAGFDPVLRGVSMEVEAGEMVAVMGPSGCGKSTMLHILGMLHTPDEGRLEILGTDVSTLDRDQAAAFRRENMGFVMQSSNLFDHSTVFENVEFPLIYEGIPPQERWERVIRALDLVRLSARVHYRSNRLSGGEQQRAAIARAMVNNPRILLADEPTGALDAVTSRLIMENFRTLCHSSGVATVMVTHDPKMAEFCDSIYTLEDGALSCRRRELAVVVSATPDGPSEPAVPGGALVTKRFSDVSEPGLLEETKSLYEKGLLSRIYAMRGGGFLKNPEDYTLPLAVRVIGNRQFFSGLLLFFRQMRDASSRVRNTWREMAGRKAGGLPRRLRAFAVGLALDRWRKEENIGYFYATDSGVLSDACFVAARLSDVPFAFVVRDSDLARPDDSLSVKAGSAAFVRCDTESARAALCKFLPDIPHDKFLYFHDVTESAERLPGFLRQPHGENP
jgi:ABC-type lipoprotein export system ATPase subunit